MFARHVFNSHNITPFNRWKTSRTKMCFLSHSNKNKEDAKSYMTNKIFLSRANIHEQVRKIVKNFDSFYENREKMDIQDQRKIEDEHLQELLNQRILKREFLNDGAAIFLKSLSFFYATTKLI